MLETLKDARNQQAWQQFVDRYRPLIVRYARRIGIQEDDAKDAAQQTLVRFMTAYSQGKYDRQKGRLRHWLFGIAHNQVRDLLRSRQRHVQVSDRSDQTGLFARIPAPEVFEKAWEQEWRQTLLRQCLDVVRRECDARTIQAFELVTYQGWPAQRVAEHLGMTSNAVSLARFRILKRIRELMPHLEDVW